MQNTKQKVSPQKLVVLSIAGVLLLVLALLYNPADTATNLSGSTMGTTWSVKIARTLDENQTLALQQSFQLELDTLEAIFSNWQDDSELSKLLGQTVAKKTVVSPPLFHVLQVSKVLNRKTGGFFDITLSNLVQAWGFGNTNVSLPYEKPSHTVLRNAIQTTGIEYLYLSAGNQVSLVKPLGLDLSAIAKGYVVDHMAKWLKAKQYANFLIEIGGEIIVSGFTEPGQKWRLGVADPQRPQSSLVEFTATIDAANDYLSIATSGTYLQFHEADNKFYSHIINPLTHAPVEHNTISVSILHSSNMYADAWATGLLAAGSEFGLQLANQNKIMALFINYDAANDTLSFVESESMKAYMLSNKIID